LPYAKRAKGFKAGGFLDFSNKDVPGGRTPVAFAALPDSTQTIKMDCPVLLHGLEK
jgi:hypothetical protein